MAENRLLLASVLLSILLLFPSYFYAEVFASSRVKSVLILEQPPDKVNAGQVLSFAGSLRTEDGKPIVGKTVRLKENDKLLVDNTLGSGMTDTDGRFAINWKIKSMDRHPDLTLEVYALFDGGLTYVKSRSQDYVMQIGGLMELSGWIHSKDTITIRINPFKNPEEYEPVSDYYDAVKEAADEWIEELEKRTGNDDVWKFRVVVAESGNADIVVTFKPFEEGPCP